MMPALQPHPVQTMRLRPPAHDATGRSRPLSALRRWTSLLVLASSIATIATSTRAQTSENLPSPQLLPPGGTVQAVLTNLPILRATHSGLALADARGRRLEVGPYEWSANLALNQRRESAPQTRFNEQEIGLQTGLRWPGKLTIDQALADGERQLAKHQQAEVWHEVARRLIDDWFDTLRALNTAALLEEQTQLLQRLQAITARRVQAGEAAVLERLGAEAETARWQATAVRARSQAQVLEQSLASRYPGLPTPSKLWPIPARLPASNSAIVLPHTEQLRALVNSPPALVMAEAQATQAQRQAERAHLERRGDPSVGVKTMRERNGQDRVLGVYVSLPLGGAGREADLAAAVASADMAQHQLAQTRQRVDAEAWQTVRAFTQHRAVQAQLQQALETTRRGAALQLRAYELGESPLPDLLLAQRTALEAQQAADAATLDTEQALARLLLDARRLWSAPW